MESLTFDLDAAPPPSCGTTRHMLRRYHVGELPPDEAAKLKAHADACLDCQAILVELKSDDAAFRTHIPFERFKADHETRVAASQPVTAGARRMWAWLTGGGLALALATSAAVVMMVPRTESVEQMGQRLKGKDVGLGFVLKTREGLRAGRSGEELKAGDQIQFFVRGPGQGDAALVIVGVDGKGAVTVYHAGKLPEGSTAGAVPLQDSVVLDDAVGPERFFAIYGEEKELPTLRKAAEDAAEKLVKTGVDLTEVESLPLDLPVKQDSLHIVKVAR
ncbi:MAG: hypothetical protein AB2A00_12830 [Myxococcota bacterium]